MRFDDMLATVLAQPAASDAARAAKWRQLVDLLAQPRPRADAGQLAEALAFLRAHRDKIPADTRKEIARALGGRRVSPLLLQFFGEDHPTIATPIVGTARLQPSEWLELLPAMSMTARALLRHRRDLESEVEHALASFGPSDFVLAGATESSIGERSLLLEVAGEPGETQIRELVERIEEFRRHRGTVVNESAPEVAPVGSFRWEAGPDGVITWVEGAPRGPLIGQTIATIAILGHFGVDGQAAGAFEKRSPFRDARFTVAGEGPACGDWRISGVPFFDQRRGSFLGYRGTARRPRLDEVARTDGAIPSGLFGTNLPAESLRQLIHELRTPLNAIVGFAEMIDGQYMGPAGTDYRSRAREIIDQAGKLLTAVDDLDTAARIETQRFVLKDSAADAAALLGRLHEAYQKVAAQRKSKIKIEVAADLPLARVEPGAVERMFARMLAATIGLARRNETIVASIDVAAPGGQAMLCLTIDRPRAIRNLDEPALLDPGYSPKGDWPAAPALGLGFALRLVRNLAEAAGGMLQIGADKFFLYLPAAETVGRSSGQKT